MEKLKKMPVWLIALILVSGTALGAGIWILTVNVPVEYHEPVQVYYSSEDMIPGDVPEEMEEWYGPVRLRDTRTTDATDLSYGTMHDYVRVENPIDGKDLVNLTLVITAYDENTVSTDDIGFVVIPGLVGPREIAWEWDNGDRTEAEVNGDTYDVIWETVDIEETLIPEDEVEYTVINVAADGADVDGYTIVWELSDTTV